MIRLTNYYMGIDTSAYTTSIAVIDNYNNLIYDGRIPLVVKKGKRGLRQQEAVFQHINNIPYLINDLSNKLDISKISTVSASVKPRNMEDSYMPVFKVAQGQAFSISKLLNIEYKEFSHQNGHIGAGIMSCGKKLSKQFLAIHISGGTTELLIVEENDIDFNPTIIGGTKDISAGQLIDRIGVKLGLGFPCGKELDALAKNVSEARIKPPINTEKTWINYSGAETFFYKLIQSKIYGNNEISKGVIDCIANSLANVVNFAIKMYDIKDVLFIGGVSASVTLKEILSDKLNKIGLTNVLFPSAKYCTDNAVGIAYLGANKRGVNSFGGL